MLFAIITLEISGNLHRAEPLFSDRLSQPTLRNRPPS